MPATRHRSRRRRSITISPLVQVDFLIRVNQLLADRPRPEGQTGMLSEAELAQVDAAILAGESPESFAARITGATPIDALSSNDQFYAAMAIATATHRQRAAAALAAEQARLERLVADTHFSCRDALYVFITYERKGRTGHLTGADYNALEMLVRAIWPAYAEARGIPVDAIRSVA